MIGLFNWLLNMSIKDNAIDFADEIIRVYNNFELLNEVSKKEIEIINKSFTKDAALKIISDDFKCFI